jgi:3-phenylpropionate/cinnamic acid dioxygenase small subunit
MPSSPRDDALQRLLDKDEIRDALCRYARAVDRGDWDLMRTTYHADAHDEHGDYKGGIDGLVEWLDQRFAGVDNSMHLLGNCLIDFAGPDLALVETYFVSRRLRPPTADERKSIGARDVMCREAWGRYVDRFERREGQWRVAHRTVVLEASSTSLALGGARSEGLRWGRRERGDRLYEVQSEIFGGPRGGR